MSGLGDFEVHTDCIPGDIVNVRTKEISTMNSRPTKTGYVVDVVVIDV